MNVLVVCHGNVCRSPLFSELLSRKGLNINIRQSSLKSYNDDNWKSSVVSKKIRDKSMELFNISFDGQRSRKFHIEDLEWCDYCIYFDNGNLKRLLDINSEYNYKYINAGNLIGLKSIKDPGFLSKDSEQLIEIMNLIKDSVEKFVEVYYE